MLEGESLRLILIGVFVLLSAFFSSSEAAFLSLERGRIAHLVSINKSGAKNVAKMIQDPERLLSTILLGNNLVNVAFASVVTVVATTLLEERFGLAITTIAATAFGTIILLILGEAAPKAFAIRHPERLAFWYASTLRFLDLLFWPITTLLSSLTRSLVNIAGGKERESTITEDELRTLIDVGEAEGTLEGGEAALLEAVFKFGDTRVREIMTPRTEIVSIPEGTTLDEFLKVYSKNTHTRFPVFKDTEEEIIGLISAKDILRKMAESGIDVQDPITQDIREVYFVPETKMIAAMFDEMRLSGNQMAVVVDEHGGLSGLVTLRRISEEVVGPVGEEGEGPEEEFSEISENEFQVDGIMSIPEFNEELGVELPQGEFDTIAGFVLEVLGHIPTKAEQFEYKNIGFEILEMRGLKIESLRVIIHPNPDGDIDNEFNSNETRTN